MLPDLLAGFGPTVDIECGPDGCDTGRPECQPILVTADDPDFKEGTCLEFVRSQGVPNIHCAMGRLNNNLAGDSDTILNIFLTFFLKFEFLNLKINSASAMAS